MPSILWPSKCMLPDCRGAMSVMRLKSVDFPAPFGPMSPVTEPRSTSNEQWSTATTPPKAQYALSTLSIVSDTFGYVGM